MVCDLFSSVFRTVVSITGSDEAQKFRATVTLELLKFRTLHIKISHISTFMRPFYFKFSRSLPITPSMVYRTQRSRIPTPLRYLQSNFHSLLRFT
jgi:hypothetical protein